MFGWGLEPTIVHTGQIQFKVLSSCLAKSSDSGSALLKYYVVVQLFNVQLNECVCITHINVNHQIIEFVTNSYIILIMAYNSCQEIS